jgi:acetoin:2,6-dichlorophenolindophenol oxidoreductase subunit alpha
VTAGAPISDSRRALGLELMERMLKIRHFEERAKSLHSSGHIGATHSYIGEEAIAAGVCQALRDDDYVTSYHRGHGHIIAKGGELSRCMAELFEKETGYCKGKGGTMHIADLSLGIIGANGIVGAGLPIACGGALAARLRGSDQVSISFFGDGAAAAGAFHESLNLAAIWRLPVVFVCENNGWTEFSRFEQLSAAARVAGYADGYGLPGVTVDGNDALAVHAAASEAVERARAGEGPTLIEAITTRIHEHSLDMEAIVGHLRSEEEIAEWRSRDPLARLRATLVEEGLDAAELDALEVQVERQVEDAVEFAIASPEPPIELAFTDVWCEPSEVE